jgi:hypothetical protein
MRGAMLTMLALLAGCTSDQVMRIDGVTPEAGNAIAANTVLQMVDPWQPGVQGTDLLVPAERAAAAAEAETSGAGQGRQAALGGSTSGLTD